MNNEQAQYELAQEILNQLNLELSDLINKFIKVNKIEEDIITFDGYIMEIEIKEPPNAERIEDE